MPAFLGEPSRAALAAMSTAEQLRARKIWDPRACTLSKSQCQPNTRSVTAFMGVLTWHNFDPEMALADLARFYILERLHPCNSKPPIPFVLTLSSADRSRTALTGWWTSRCKSKTPYSVQVEESAPHGFLLIALCLFHGVLMMFDNKDPECGLFILWGGAQWSAGGVWCDYWSRIQSISYFLIHLHIKIMQYYCSRIIIELLGRECLPPKRKCLPPHRGNVYHQRKCTAERGCLPAEGMLLQHMEKMLQYLVRVHLHHAGSYHKDGGGQGWPVLQKWIRKIRTSKKNRTGHGEGDSRWVNKWLGSGYDPAMEWR